MTTEIWDRDEKIADFAWKILPERGDILELQIEKETVLFEVETLRKYYGVNESDPVCRIIVKRAGASLFGAL